MEEVEEGRVGGNNFLVVTKGRLYGVVAVDVMKDEECEGCQMVRLLTSC